MQYPRAGQLFCPSPDIASLVCSRQGLFLEWPECGLLREWVPRFLSGVPIEFGAETKDEDCGKPYDGQHPVVPDEHRAVEHASEEVAAGNYARTQHGDGGDPDAADGGGGTQRGL